MHKIAFLFPGQGSQSVGMCKDLYDEFSSVREIFDMAEETSKLNIKALCFDGPMEALTRTVNLQPAITTANLACLTAIKSAYQSKPDFCAGHSLGEYSALYQSGIISAQDTFKIVLDRGRLMQREADSHPGKMAAVLKLTLDEVSQLVDDLKSEGVISIANHNSEKQIVITGAPDLIRQASKKIRTLKGITVPLKVSGAWHSDLIKGAHEEFEQVLKSVEFKSPAIPVIFNVTADIESDPEKIKTLMARQFCMPVRWHETILQMLKNKVDTFVEIGPGAVLSGLIAKIVSPGYPYRIFNIQDTGSLHSFLEENT